MKKILFIVLALFAFVARADNVITSKEYVDTQAGGLQEQIGANDANTVLTYTDTAGTVGEKKIYDSSDDYASQQDALVTAGAFNTAIQNALETEFVCIDWLGDVHDNAHCLLYQIRTSTPKPSGKNLFNVNGAKVLYKSTTTEVTTTGTGIMLTAAPSETQNRIIVFEIGDVDKLLGKTLTISAQAGANCEYMRYFMGYSDANGKNRVGWSSSHTMTVTEQTGGQEKVVAWFYAYYSRQHCGEYLNIQVEEGPVATEYEPYQNLYLPSGN